MISRIACLCPTYKRPECLPNAAACYINQEIHHDYLKVDTRLFILDDAGQYKSETIRRSHNVGFSTITIVSHKDRLPSLPAKYQALIDLANEWEADAYVIWEDDDVFLPWHLSNIWRGFENSVRYYRHPEVWSNYMENKQGMHLEGAAGRFHSSWAFTRDIYEQVGGYMGLENTGALNFDQQLGGKLRAADPDCPINDSYLPSYVYRWGNSTYHGSAYGDNGYQHLWDELGNRPAPFLGPLEPEFDSETEIIWRKALAIKGQFLERHPEQARSYAGSPVH